MSRTTNIRVFVHFKDLTVFAGEEVECTITFKNVESTRRPPRRDSVAHSSSTRSRIGEPLDQSRGSRAPALPAPPGSTSAQSQPTTKAPDILQPAQRTGSLSSLAESEGEQKPSELASGSVPIAISGSERKHRKSVSIITLPNSAPGKRHGRSTSLQYLPTAGHGRNKASLGGNRSPGPGSPSPLSDSSTPPTFPEPLLEQTVPPRPFRRRSESKTTQSEAPTTTHSRNASLALKRSANNPSSPIAGALSPQLAPLAERLSSNADAAASSQLLPPPHGADGQFEETTHLKRMFSVRSNDESPRSSADFYSTSNRSNETLASEYPMQLSSRLLNTLQFTRQSSQLGRTTPPPGLVEMLMMGYVQIQGSFILDGSLVNQAPFEEVKRKAVVGGQAGGGVVGIAQPHGDSGLFGALSWGSIGGSIGGLLSSGQPSSIREMKGIADSKSVPLLSTPKSILFVDLRLAPGESKSYAYSFRMPRGLPPTHKGRAMKVSYNVIIGTQRAASSKNQQQEIKQVEVPFRVFSGVNNLGEGLGHDLMSPYIILKDQARIIALDPDSPLPQTTHRTTDSSNTQSSATDFQSYVHYLLTAPRKNSTSGLLSPTADFDSPTATPSAFDTTIYNYNSTQTPPSTRTLIDHAIRASTLPNSAIYSPTNFTIARSSIPIATLMLSRPAIKLGDLLTCVLDFAIAKLPCYALEATLESSEKVDPALAIRSPQSVERATRRVWGRCAESCLWARRVSVAFQVPVGATPGFGTTGVGLEWCVRVEIVVGKEGEASRVGRASQEMESAAGEESEGEGAVPPSQVVAQLLEVVASDERGTTLAARQRLPCESFEVTIPIRVFGAAVGDGEDGTGEEGFVV